MARVAAAASAAQHRAYAIYTRKSSEEGLEQDFNSLDAQREACAAYVQSQRAEGWRLLDDAYDDGGISGGTLQRPALQRLLADIAQRRVDIVVVYKVDRLTRSLTDFARLVEIFDRHAVWFVSVTQQFNTTSSMGRLTLNVLLSFAQFEREVTAERIRDKIAASKKKGLWMGGLVPLGYRADGRTLAIEPDEALLVQRIFTTFVELGCVRQLQAELARQGIVSKRRVSTSGRHTGRLSFSRGHLYRLLANPLYRGEIAHKGQCYPGQHPPIIDAATWKAVRARLDGNARKAGRAGAKLVSPLAGKLVDAEGRRLTPSHAVKAGKRYRYYISQALVGGEAKAAGQRWRLPAAEIEGPVRRQLAAMLADPQAMPDQLGTVDTDALRQVIDRAGRLGSSLREDDVLANELLQQLVARVVLGEGRVGIELDRAALRQHLGLQAGEPPPGPAVLVARVQCKRRGVETRLVLAGQSSEPGKPDPALLKAIARGHAWLSELVKGAVPSIPAIAARDGVTPAYVSRLIDTALLAPDIVQAILDGRQPVELTAQRLMQHRAIALGWNQQRRELGFSATEQS